MSVYIDICFLINFVMDMAVFYITSVIAKNSFKKEAMVIVCAAESMLFCVLAAAGYIFSTAGFLIAVVSNMASVYLVFKPVSIKRFIELTLIMMLTAFTLCGFVIWLLYFSNIPQALMAFFGMGYGKYTAAVLIFSSIVSYCFIKIWGRWLDKSYAQREKYCRIKIYKNGGCAEVSALIDSGCFLKGENGRPVIVVESTALLSMFKDNPEYIFSPEKADSYLSYCALGKDKGKLPVIKAYKAEFIFSNTESIFCGADIALYCGILSANGGYNAIISDEDWLKIRRKCK